MVARSPVRTKIYLGTQAAAATVSEFEADTYTEVRPVESIGSFGESADVIKYSVLGEGYVQKVAGQRDSGELELSLIYDPADTGQIALLAAFDGNTGAPFNVKVEFDDALIIGAGPHHGTRAYCKVIVTDKSFDTVSSKDVIRLKAKLAITGGVTMSAAA